MDQTAPPRSVNNVDKEVSPRTNRYQKTGKIKSMNNFDKEETFSRYMVSRRFPVLRHRRPDEGIKDVSSMSPRPVLADAYSGATGNPSTLVDPRFFSSDEGDADGPLAVYRSNVMNKHARGVYGSEQQTFMARQQRNIHRNDTRTLQEGAQRLPWSPVNPVNAKNMMDSRLTSTSVFEGSPYEAEHLVWRQWAQAERAARGRPFYAPCPSAAKDALVPDYYLNSDDATVKEAERRLVRDKARANVQTFKQTLASSPRKKVPRGKDLYSKCRPMYTDDPGSW